jgi:predicted methyltransferase
MTIRTRPAFAVTVALLCLLGAAPAHAETDALQRAIDGPQRTAPNRERDGHRHPAETLRFFGMQPQQTVVEIWPGGRGWWTEILAPYLRGQGQYIAALAADPVDGESAGNRAFRAKLAADPAIYQGVRSVVFDGDAVGFIAPASADVILTFRNLHNWIARGTADTAFAAFYAALKPGGVLGIEDHRAPADQPIDPKATSGYVREDVAIALASQAGFRLVARSEVNANPKDTKDHPGGVWALPPTFALKDQDRARYAAVGESDRFTLKFVKPLAVQH